MDLTQSNFCTKYIMKSEYYLIGLSGKRRWEQCNLWKVAVLSNLSAFTELRVPFQTALYIIFLPSHKCHFPVKLHRCHVPVEEYDNNVWRVRGYFFAQAMACYFKVDRPPCGLNEELKYPHYSSHIDTRSRKYLLINYVFHQTLLNQSNKNCDISRACGTYGNVDKHVQNFSTKSSNEGTIRNPWLGCENISRVDFKQEGGRNIDWFVWIRVLSNGHLLWTRE